jgi:hypothetical protein
MMKWVYEITNRKRLKNQIIWSFDLINWILFHYIIIAFFMHERFDFESHLFIWDDSYRRFFIHMLIARRVVLRSFNRDDFFHIYWFSKSSRSQKARKWVCNSDEIRLKWQRSSKMTWLKEKIFVTNEDLDSQKDLDESWDKKSINEIIKEEFLYNELNFLFKLNKQQLTIYSFVSQ